LSGQKARRFRARWAACAKQAEGTIRTIKLPLEAPEGHSIDSAAFMELHATLRELRPGTLLWLLLTVHSLGFRIFSKSDEVSAFQNSDLLGNDAYRMAFRVAAGVSCERIDPVHLFLRFRTIPRPSRGTAMPFTAEVIAREYIRYFSWGKADPADSALVGLMSDLSCRLEGLGGWKGVASDLGRAFEAWDEVVRARGIDVPALAPRMRRLVFPAKAVAKATIAYDRRKPKIDLDSSDSLPVLVAQALSEARSHGLTAAPALTKRALQVLLTDNYSGLSWLWGAGLRLLRDATGSECREWFGVEMETAETLLHAAKSIPPDRVFGDDGYAAYRADVGGALASWVTRHVAALVAFDDHLNRRPDHIALGRDLPANEPRPLAICAGTDGDELTIRVEEAQVAFEIARSSLDRLLGYENGASADDVRSLERYSKATAALHRHLSAIAVQANLAKERDRPRGMASVEALQTWDFQVPSWCLPLPKLNQMSRALEPVEQSRAAAARLAGIAGAMNAYAESIVSWCDGSGIPVLPIERLAEGKRRVVLQPGAPPDAISDEALLNAIRQILDRFGKIARRQPSRIAKCIMGVYDSLEIFSRREELHRYFLSRQGTLYKQPFDRGVRQVMSIEEGVVDRRHLLLPAIKEALQRLRRELLDSSFKWSERSASLELERAYYAILLTGLPQTVPSAVAAPPAEPHLPISAALQRLLQAPTVSASVARRIFNLYAVELRALTAILSRRHFFVRHTFARSRDDALTYVPKDVSWRPPERLGRSARPIGAAFRALGFGSSDLVSPRQLVARAAESLGSQPGVCELLAQSPHDWYYCGLPGGVLVKGLSMSKVGAGRRPANYRGAWRLIGPSSLKTGLDRALLHRRATIGDIQVICDRHFVQQLERGRDGVLQATIREIKCSLTLGVPLRERADSFGRPISMDRYLCVDLGEYGLGWTAFDARTHEEVASGFKAIASLRSLARQIKAGRRPRERELRFHAGHEGGMENARKRVAGQVIHTINSLLSKFRAFPVLETRHGYYQSNGHIERVHELVIETYMFVNKECATRRRKSHWWGGSIWSHPYLQRKEGDLGGATPLNLFPGAVVPANGNSQTCSHCGRNAIETVREMSSNGSPMAFAVTVGGRVHLSNGTIVLYRKNSSKAAREDYRLKGEHAPRDTAYRPGSIVAQSLLAAIRANIRRPPVRKHISASSNSRYFCVYADCAISEHADINAARNIGRRFRERLFAEAH
jgi:hypothetical protein